MGRGRPRAGRGQGASVAGIDSHVRVRSHRSGEEAGCGGDSHHGYHGEGSRGVGAGRGDDRSNHPKGRDDAQAVGSENVHSGRCGGSHPEAVKTMSVESRLCAM